MIIRRRPPDPERVLTTAQGLEPRVTLVDGVLTWQDGPSLGAMAAHLQASIGPVRLVVSDYLGSSWDSERHASRAPSVTVDRTLSPEALLVVVLRAWGAWGPLGAHSAAPPDALARVAETPGDYPIPAAMARILVARGASPQRPSEAIEAVGAVGYERLWAEAWKLLG